MASLKACLAGFVASSRADLGLLVWDVFMGIIYAQLALRVKGFSTSLVITCLIIVV